MCNAVVYFPGCWVIDAEIDLIKPFFYMVKKTGYKFNLTTKRAFKVKWQTFLIVFKGLAVAKNCLRPEGAPLNVLLGSEYTSDNSAK